MMFIFSYCFFRFTPFYSTDSWAPYLAERRQEDLRPGRGGGSVHFSDNDAIVLHILAHIAFYFHDGMRCCRNDWPGLRLFCCYQPCVSQQSQFGFFCFMYSNSTPPPPLTPQCHLDITHYVSLTHEEEVKIEKEANLMIQSRLGLVYCYSFIWASGFIGYQVIQLFTDYTENDVVYIYVIIIA